MGQWLVAMAMACVVGVSPAAAGEGYPLRPLREMAPRGGLPNFYAKLRAGTPVKIAYFGGSITEQHGWREYSRRYFQARFPGVEIGEINAAIGGTGSGLGVFRIDNDVFPHKPDLMFVEFAVNDDTTSPDNITRAFEGFVRKTWKLFPDCDIAFIYTLTDANSKTVLGGNMQRSASVMEAIADRYGIPSVHFGFEVAHLLKSGKLVMKAAKDADVTRVSGAELDALAGLALTADGKIPFSGDGVHPYPDTGQKIYEMSLERALAGIDGVGAPGPHALPEPLRADNWENAKMLPLSRVNPEKLERLPADAPIAKKFFPRAPEMWRAGAGGELTFKFKGTKAMVYDIMGPEGAVLEIVLDDKPPREITRMDGYCTYERLGNLGVGDNLPNAEHTVSVRVLDKQFDKNKVLFERNRKDMADKPEKYAPYNWYASAILIIGELVE